MARWTVKTTPRKIVRTYREALIVSLLAPG